MLFHELVQKFQVDDVLPRYFELYPKRKKFIKEYTIALDRLNKIVPKIPVDDADKMIIFCREEEDDFPLEGEEGKTYASVSGKQPFPKEGEPTSPSWGIEYCPWDEWLGWEVCDDSIKLYGELDFFCHCLFEVTWGGCTEEACQKSRDAIEERTDSDESVEIKQQKLHD